MKLKNVAMTAGMILSAAVAFADNGTEFGVDDDLTVWGTQGSTADADVEIKGFTVFGSTTANNLAVFSGTGSVFMGGALEVSSNTYLHGSVVVGTTTSQGIFAVKDNFVVTSGGNVGIGTTSPTGKLSAQGTGTYYGLFVSTDSAGSVGNLVVDNSGNVGIGTTGPGYNLDITTNGHPGVRISRTGSNAELLMGVTGDYVTFGSSFGSRSAFEIHKDAGGACLVIDNSGNVGIGTAGPGQKLDVVGNILINGTGNWLSYNSTGYFGSGSVITGGLGTDTAVRTNGNLLFSSGASGTTERMRIDTSGNIGIGYTIPGQKLTVLSTGGLPASSETTQNGVARFMLSNGATLDLGVNSASPYQSWLQATDVTDLSITRPLLLNPNGGNVGIGTTSPTAVLQVQTATEGSTLGSNTAFWASGGSAINRLAQIGLGYKGPNGIPPAVIAWQADSNNSYQGNLIFSIASRGDYTTAPTAAMTILSNGNVGIGTTNPTGKLYVSTGAGTANLFIDSTNGNVGIGTTSPDDFLKIAGAGGGGITIKRTSGSAQLTLVSSGGTGILAETESNLLQLRNAPSGAVHVTIDGTGNVGIGTISPGTNLDVNGTMRLKLNSAAPYNCDSSHDGAIAATSQYTSCICRSGTGWVKINDGVSACNWNCSGTTVIFLTSGNSWTVPACWNNSNNSIEAIGGGGGGAYYGTWGGGGGGGEYRKIINFSSTPGTVIPYSIGAGGAGGNSGNHAGGNGGDTIFNTSSLIAKGGSGAPGNGTGGAGGTGGTGPAAHYNGGTGGTNNGANCGEGGGGAGGPYGAGGNGGTGTNNYEGGGGGGGGGGGTAGGNDVGPANSNNINGASGGNNHLGSGAGAGGTSSSLAGSDGTNSGGGGGGWGNYSGGATTPGGNGGAGTEWDASHGSGGGGGGAGAGGNPSNGGSGGLYGGGGGSGASGGSASGSAGAQGIIVIQYSN